VKALSNKLTVSCDITIIGEDLSKIQNTTSKQKNKEKISSKGQIANKLTSIKSNFSLISFQANEDGGSEVLKTTTNRRMKRKENSFSLRLI
jgi:hypothetical protein